ncbi:hypothetical protein G6F68_019976 [Rhizopus microsporus]|nr:hypothetical protein G6F68_019976 [Rhizopus microsporus]
MVDRTDSVKFSRPDLSFFSSSLFWAMSLEGITEAIPAPAAVVAATFTDSEIFMTSSLASFVFLLEIAPAKS